jgi:predicted dehydrogenase
VVIGSPDHWHAIQVVAACEAGKDVYVEKPLSLTIQEGRRMVEAAARHQRISQVGLQRRSCRTYQDLEKLVKKGEIGQVTTARAYRISNMHPQGIGRGRKMDPPAGLDWDAWLGPAAWRDYQDNIAPYKFRWWKQYSSQAANWGVHYFDTIRWMLGEEAPLSISAHGTHVAVGDDRTIPDTMEVIFEFPSGKLLIFGQYEASSGRAMLTGEIELRGTKGNLFCDEDGYRMVPSQAGQFQSGEPAKEELQVQNRAQDLTADHMRNFLDCVRSRKRCRCDLETGHRSNTFALLANMAMDTKSRLEWDPVAEKVTNHPEANQLLQYEYRRPWRLG